MNILYIHQYFKTPSEPGGTRSYWIAKELKNREHDIHIITTSVSIEKPIETRIIEGLTVTYFRIAYNNNMGVLKRLIAFARFMIHSTLFAIQQKNVDLVIATSTPLTVGFPALILKKIRHIPYIFEVRDLWPEVPIQMGAIKNSIIINIARWFEKSIYKNANHVVALSPGMQEGVLQYLPLEKTTMIPNMSKIDEFGPREKNYNLMISLGLSENTFKVIHFGALGIANGVSYIIESANLLKDDSTVEFIFVGGGSTEEELKDECKKNNLRNVKFLGEFSMKEISEIVNFCDISIVSFKDIPILYTNSPNKLFDSLSAGKPVIVNSAGWTKKMVEENNCGYYVNPHIPSELVEKIKYLQNNPKEIEIMGRKSRWLAENVYDKSILCKQFAELIEKYV